MKKRNFLPLACLFLVGCGQKESFTAHNEPFYCDAPKAEAAYDFVRLSGHLEKKENSKFEFYCNSQTDYGFYGLIDGNTKIYHNAEPVNAIPDTTSSSLSIDAYFSTKTKSENANWLRITRVPMAENITYLVIGETPEQLKTIDCYTGNAFE